MKTFNVKNFLFLCCFLLASTTQLNAQEFNPIPLYRDLQPNTTYAVFGDNVNLREKPSTTAKEITRLRIGFEITVLSKTAVMFKSGNSETPWYEVRYQNQKGYIPGKFIAYETITHTAYSLFFNKADTDKLAIRTLVEKNYNEYQENFMQLRGSMVSAELEENHGLKNVSKILKIRHQGDSCGADNGITYYFLKDTYELVYIAHLSVSGDGGYFESETFTFTTDEDSNEPIILFEKEEGELVDGESNWTETKSMTRHFQWNGTKLVPNFSKEFYRQKN